MRLVSRFVKTMLLSAGLAFILSSGQNLRADDAKPEAAKAETAKSEAVKNEAQASEENPPPCKSWPVTSIARTGAPLAKRSAATSRNRSRKNSRTNSSRARSSVGMIDFQDSKNKEQIDAYKITGPTLILLDVRDGKVKAGSPPPRFGASSRRKTIRSTNTCRRKLTATWRANNGRVDPEGSASPLPGIGYRLWG